MNGTDQRALVQARIDRVISLFKEREGGIAWLKREGDLIASGPASLSKRSRVCLLGFNPGGCETTGRTLQETLQEFPRVLMSDEGIAATWTDGMKRGYERIGNILHLDEIEAPYVANLFPLPTPGVPGFWKRIDKLQGGSQSSTSREQLVKSIWPVHEYLFKELDPDLIISIGLSGTAFSSVQRILFDVINGGSGDWNVRPAQWQGLELGSMKYARIGIGGRERHVVGVTHFSRLGTTSPRFQ